MTDAMLIVSEGMASASEYYSDCGPGDYLGSPPESTLASPFQSTTSVRWQTSATLLELPLTAQHTLIFNASTPSRVVIVRRPVARLLAFFKMPRRLAELPADMYPADLMCAAKKLADLQLLQPVDVNWHCPTPTAEAVSVWLHLTRQCNLRCDYCYVSPSAESMDETTGYAAVEAAFRSAGQHGSRQLKIKYAGGEPTLNFGLLRRLHDHAAALAMQTGIELSEAMLSNGVALTADMAAYLAAEHIHLMISLDGGRAAHDAQRPQVTGQGSFDAVRQGLERALSYGLRPNLTITITERNADRVAAAIAWALEHDLRFNLNFLRRPGQPLPSEKLLAAGRQALVVIESYRPAQRLIDNLLDHCSFARAHAYPCGAGHAYLVVDPRGRVARCQMDIERAVATVGDADPLEKVRQAQTDFQNVAVTEKKECSLCNWRYVCAGGCPLYTYRLCGRNDVRSPYCDAYRILLPELLRLEGLRLLQWPPAG